MVGPPRGVTEAMTEGGQWSFVSVFMRVSVFTRVTLCSVHALSVVVLVTPRIGRVVVKVVGGRSRHSGGTSTPGPPSALAIDILLFEPNPFTKSIMNARIDKPIANNLMGPPILIFPQWA